MLSWRAYREIFPFHKTLCHSCWCWLLTTSLFPMRCWRLSCTLYPLSWETLGNCVWITSSFSDGVWHSVVPWEWTAPEFHAALIRIKLQFRLWVYGKNELTQIILSLFHSSFFAINHLHLCVSFHNSVKIGKLRHECSKDILPNFSQSHWAFWSRIHPAQLYPQIKYTIFTLCWF